MPPLLNYGKRCVQAISQLASLLRKALIGGYDDIISLLFLNKITRQQNLRRQFIHGYIEESLDLTRVHIHGQHSMSASYRNAICDQASGDRHTRLIFLVRATIGVIGNNGSDPGGGCTFEGINHDEQFHDGAIDRGAERLNNEHIAPAYIIIDLYKYIF